MTTDERIKTIRDALLPLDDAWDALNSLVAELDAAREQLQKYEDAARYSGDDQRHRGASVASQLVHAQHMREKAEAELDAARAREAKLREKAQNYMSQFGQALEAHDIPYAAAQSEADSALRAALAEGEGTRG